MNFKLAKKDLISKSENITLKEMQKSVKDEKCNIFYLDFKDANKEIEALKEHFLKINYNVYSKEIQFGTDNTSSIFEIHIV